MSAKAKVSGSVVAGFPSPTEQYLEPLGLRLPSKADAFSADILDLNELLVKRPAATYFVRVEGDKQGTGNREQIINQLQGGKMTNDYRDLVVWQQSMTLCQEVYTLIRQFPPEERYALCDQLRRAVVSIPSNIAEGNGRDSRTEYARFLAIARGSVFEVQTQLELAERFGYITIPSTVKALLTDISKMLFTMIRKFRSA